MMIFASFSSFSSILLWPATSVWLCSGLSGCDELNSLCSLKIKEVFVLFKHAVFSLSITYVEFRQGFRTLVENHLKI